MEKVITKRTVYSYHSLAKNFLEYDEAYITIRTKRCSGTLLSCFECGDKPEFKSMIGLLFTDKGNKIVCSKCQEIIGASMPSDKVCDRANKDFKTQPSDTEKGETK